jgi:hypothetical protein
MWQWLRETLPSKRRGELLKSLIDEKFFPISRYFQPKNPFLINPPMVMEVMG